jgi:hypothetical protein
MELTEGSETSANYNLTPGKYPKEQIQKLVLLHSLQFIQKKEEEFQQTVCLLSLSVLYSSRKE